MNKFYIRQIIGLFVVMGLVILFNNFIYEEKQSDNLFEPYRASLSGEYLCLPHKEDIGEIPLDCVFGIKTDAGEYYGVNFFLMSQMHDPIEIGQRISANGSVVPVERLSAAQWRLYPVEGIFSVTDSLRVIK